MKLSPQAGRIGLIGASRASLYQTPSAADPHPADDWQLEENTDVWLLEDGSGSWILEEN